MILYSKQKKGKFRIETGEYNPILGWVQKEETYNIIGEDVETFIERILPLSYGMWENGKVRQINTTIGIGPHKSRLIKWLDFQLQLF